MENKPRNLALVGSIINIVGSLLPWGCQGDFGWYCTPGIGVYVIPVVRAEDNGGFPIVLLSCFVAVLIIHAPTFIKKPALLAGVYATLLMAASIYHAGSWVLYSLQYPGWTGAPVPAIGLAVLFVGSSVLLLAARDFHQATST